MNKQHVGIVALAMVALLTVSFVSAFCSDNGFMNPALSEDEKADMQAQAEAIQSAIADNDYSEWKSLMEAQLTEERFDQLVERYNEMSEMQELRDEMEQAWEDEDYAKVKELREQMQENMPEKPENAGSEAPMQMHRQGPGFWDKFAFWRGE